MYYDRSLHVHPAFWYYWQYETKKDKGRVPSSVMLFIPISQVMKILLVGRINIKTQGFL